jgi:hypothetical protein
VTVAAIVVMTATPIAPPICWVVLISPDATPASAGFECDDGDADRDVDEKDP